MKTALIFSGGYEGHQPERIAERFEAELSKLDFKVDRSTSLDVLKPGNDLGKYQIIIPNWTLGALGPEATKNLSDAVKSGVGIAGIHGGMGDAFRGNNEYEWMVGGHFVSHPHVGDYAVELVDLDHTITRGLPKSFPYRSEEYYLMVDPSIDLLARASYHYEGKDFLMPIAWTKKWGKGRVFYSSLGHDVREFDEFPVSLQLALQGICWAAA